MITDEDIRQLRAEGREFEDNAQVRLCDLALSGDPRARIELEKIVEDTHS